MNVIVLNVFLYVGTAVMFLYKYKSLNIYVFYWFFLAILSVFSLLSLIQGAYYDSVSLNEGLKFPLLGYFLYYISNLIISWPLKNIKIEQIDIESVVHSKSYDYFIFLSLIVGVSYGFVKLYESIVVASLGFDVAYDLRHYSGDILFHYDNFILKHLVSEGRRFFILSQPFVVVYFFQRIVSNNRKIYLYVLGIIFCFFPTVTEALAKGSKGALFFVGTTLLFYYLLFKKNFSDKLERLFRIAILSGGLLMAFYAYNIQNDRAGGDTDVTENTILRYMAEPMLNLGYYVWDDVKTHPYGARLFPELFDVPKFESVDDRFSYWTNITGIPEAKFTTTWGDFYVEFGPFLGIIMLLLLYWVWNKFLTNNYMNFYFIPITYYFYHYFCIMAMFDYSFFEPAQHYWFVITILFCFAVKHIFSNSSESYGS